MSESRFKQNGIIGLLILIPCLLGVGWGVHLNDAAFEFISFARDRVVGQGINQGITDNQVLISQSPLYLQFLILSARIGLSLPWVGLIVGILGWSLTAVSVYVIGRIMDRPFATIIASSLVAMTPVFLPLLGSELPWFIALSWLAIILSMRRQWRLQVVVLIFVLLTHFGIAALSLSFLLLAARWFLERRLPWRSGTALTLVIIAIRWMVIRSPQLPVGMLSAEVADWPEILRSTKYAWLFIAPAALGLLKLGRESSRYPPLIAAVIWNGALIILGDSTAVPVTAVILFLLTGLGIEGIIDRLQEDQASRKLFLASLISLPLYLTQAALLIQHFQERPLTRYQLEQQAGHWLRDISESEVTIASSARVAYWADRPLFQAWDSSEPLPSLTVAKETLPDYIVTGRYITANQMERTDWFQEQYEIVQQLSSPYVSSSPLVVWGYRPTVYDLGEGRPLNVKVADKLEIVGYQYEPERVSPGQPFQLKLFMRPMKSIEDPFQTTLRLVSVANGQVFGETSIMTPQSNDVAAWSPGEVIDEQFTLETTADIPVGAYELNFSLGMPEDTDNGVVWPLFRNNDVNMLDRIALGIVVVPWQGDYSQAIPIDASFGDQIGLTAFEIDGDLASGEPINVKLYWEAVRIPEEDYTVFVHVLDSSGQLVSGHDGAPVDGRFPTTAWLRGDILQDIHVVHFETPPGSGDYRIRVGLYLPATGERLPVWDSLGVEQPERSISLTTISVH